MALFDGVDDAGEERRRSRAWWVLGVLVLLFVAAYVALHVLAAERVPLGTKVAGVSIGGMTVSAAEERLNETLGPDLNRAIPFVHDDRTYPFIPSEAGVGVDLGATVRATGAGHSRWSPGGLWHYFTGGRSGDPVLKVPAQRFTNALDQLTARVGQPAVEGTVEFRDGRPVPVYGRTGLVVDHDKTRTLVARLAFDPHQAELPVLTRSPYISDAAVRKALHDFAQPAMSGNVTLVIGGRKVVAPPRLFGKAISMVPQEGRLVPLVNGHALLTALQPAMRTLGEKPKDATVRIVGGRPVVVPAVYGAAYDVDALAEEFPTLVVQPPGRRTLDVHAAITVPTRTTAQARALGITHRIGSFTVDGGTALAGGLDGTLVTPGQSMSLADQVGTPSRPLGTALFMAALRAGLVIDSHTPAPTHDAGMPAGREMTDVELVAGRHGVLVTATVAPGSADRVTVSIWSTREWRSEVRIGAPTGVVPGTPHDDNAADCVARPGVTGFDIVVTRLRTPVGGGPAVTDTFRTHYLPVDTIRCVPTTTSPTPSVSSG